MSHFTNLSIYNGETGKKYRLITMKRDEKKLSGLFNALAPSRRRKAAGSLRQLCGGCLLARDASIRLKRDSDGVMRQHLRARASEAGE